MNIRDGVISARARLAGRHMEVLGYRLKSPQGVFSDGIYCYYCVRVFGAAFVSCDDDGVEEITLTTVANHPLCCNRCGDVLPVMLTEEALERLADHFYREEGWVASQADRNILDHYGRAIGWAIDLYGQVVPSPTGTVEEIIAAIDSLAGMNDGEL